MSERSDADDDDDDKHGADDDDGEDGVEPCDENDGEDDDEAIGFRDVLEVQKLNYVLCFCDSHRECACGCSFCCASTAVVSGAASRLVKARK